MNDQANLPATLRSLPEVVAEYDAKCAAVDDLIKAFNSSVAAIEVGSVVGGTYVGSIWGRYGNSHAPGTDTIKANLLKSAWKHVYRGLNIHRIASAKDRSQFDLAFENPVEFTLDNLRATFGPYLVDSRFHILKGLAECFTDLDPAYKSHSKVKIGVAGLPKRIILNNVTGRYSYGTYGQEKLRDTLNAVQVFRGKPHLEYRDFEKMVTEAREKGEADCPLGKLRGFANGNAHLIFDKDSLLEVNRALAEFYGDVLPDVEPDDLFRRPGTDVAKDLQFYWTPPAVVARICEKLNGLGARSGERYTVLEPSCGDGRMMDVLRDWSRTPGQYQRRPDLAMTGVEYHAGRAEEARAKGHAVLTENFLNVRPAPRFDFVVMNPPFYGKHWRKHLDHARKFLKPCPDGQRWGGGTLICILPATAYYDGHLDDLIGKRGRDDGWTDLPVASFADAGTNVPTGFVVLGAE